MTAERRLYYSVAKPRKSPRISQGRFEFDITSGNAAKFAYPINKIHRSPQIISQSHAKSAIAVLAEYSKLEVKWKVHQVTPPQKGCAGVKSSAINRTLLITAIVFPRDCRVASFSCGLPLWCRVRPNRHRGPPTKLTASSNSSICGNILGGVRLWSQFAPKMLAPRRTFHHVRPFFSNVDTMATFGILRRLGVVEM